MQTDKGQKLEAWHGQTDCVTKQKALSEKGQERENNRGKTIKDTQANYFKM